MIRWISTILLLTSFALGLHGATWQEMKQDCTNAKRTFFPRAGGCIADAFQLSDIPHAAVHSFPPAGSIGFGARYTKPFNSKVWERTLDTGAAISVRGFWYADAKLTVMRIGNPLAAHPTDEQFGFHVYANYEHFASLSFYGLGPQSLRSDLTNFRQDLATLGTDVQKPLNNFFTVGANIVGLIPDVGPSHGSDPSIETRFSEATAPGLAKQPPTVRYGGFLRFHHNSPQQMQDFEDRISYDYYQDVDGGHYSFRRFRADVKHNFYPFRGTRRPRRDRVLSIHGILSFSDTGAGKQVPFYLQETIGGRGIDGEATLRAFDDYRFRAPYLTVIQVEYAHRVWASKPVAPRAGPGSLSEGILHTLGVFVFYDVGQVALQRGDLDIGAMRHSFGGGIAIFVGGFLQARFFVGLGGGEGYHTFSVLPRF